MTDLQKEQITRLRGEGFGYKKISDLLHLSDNTIKSFCRRKGLTGASGFEQRDVIQGDFCKNCGLPIKQYLGRKKKIFCCGKCRQSWWNSHLDQVKQKAIYDFICEYCHKPFTAYGNANRKYCCRDCYFNDRFGGGNHE